jgi:hypothetical protein
MSISDIKLYAMNAGALGITTFTRLEMGLKIFLLLVTIGYTIHTCIHLQKNKNNNMWKLTKQYWINVWNLLWSKTNIDEKALATVKEIKKRYKLTAKELKDVAKAIIEVGDQIGDIPDAIKGKARSGRKTKK